MMVNNADWLDELHLYPVTCATSGAIFSVNRMLDPDSIRLRWSATNLGFLELKSIRSCRLTTLSSWRGDSAVAADRRLRQWGNIVGG